MSGTTPTYGFPYPTASDIPAGHTQMQALAQGVEDRIVIVNNKITTLDRDATAPIGGEWRDARTTPAISTGSNKLQFATNVFAANGITFNGTDTWTVVTTGVYSVFCQLRETTAQNAGIAMGATTYADSTHILPFLGFTAGPDIGLSGVVKLTAGTQFCMWCYVNGSATTIANGTRNAVCKIWRTA